MGMNKNYLTLAKKTIEDEENEPPIYSYTSF